MDFKEHIYFFLQQIRDKKNFALPRYSDGELFMLKRKSIFLHKDRNFVEGDIDHSHKRPVYDTKHFDSSEHTEFIDHLIESFSHTQEEYYKGICCRCCVGDSQFDWQFQFLN